MELLHWDASYEIVLALMREYPNVDFENLGYTALHQMIITLPAFGDDPTLANSTILREIFREWYEEVNAP